MVIKVTILQRSNSQDRHFKKDSQVNSHVKTMLICFFDVRGVVQLEFIPHGRTFFLLKRFEQIVHKFAPNKT